MSRQLELQVSPSASNRTSIIPFSNALLVYEDNFLEFLEGGCRHKGFQARGTTQLSTPSPSFIQNRLGFKLGHMFLGKPKLEVGETVYE